MKRFLFFVYLAFLLPLVFIGITSAVTPAATTMPERTGGSIYFETSPSEATIWLDDVKLGASPFTYFSEKTGTLSVRVQKKGFEDYTDKVTVSNGDRVNFYARLTPLRYDLNEVTTTVAPVTTITSSRKSTMIIPTPWPTSSPASPADPAVVIGAAAVGIGLFAIRRR